MFELDWGQNAPEKNQVFDLLSIKIPMVVCAAEGGLP